jgi:hypothetical protein
MGGLREMDGWMECRREREERERVSSRLERGIGTRVAERERERGRGRDRERRERGKEGGKEGARQLQSNERCEIVLRPRTSRVLEMMEK